MPWDPQLTIYRTLISGIDPEKDVKFQDLVKTADAENDDPQKKKVVCYIIVYVRYISSYNRCLGYYIV